ncbi:MAG TPA: dipeptidase PepV [Clostridiales bacterium]|nr:dipeptidase PepV [Clostridiales bacterium]
MDHTMKRYEKEMTNTLLSLLSVNSVQGEPAEGAPFGKGTKQALERFLRVAASFGMQTKDLDGYCGYAEIGEGELLGIPFHLDTVPFGEDWSHSPLGEVVTQGEERVIYGRGTEDDKGPAVAVLYALKSLLDECRTPKRRVRLIAGLNEESGWKCIEHYLATQEIPALSFSPDADFPVIHSEKGVCHLTLTFDLPQEVYSFSGGERVNMVADRATLEVATLSDAAFSKCLKGGIKVKMTEKGFLLSATGISAHGSTPEKGENALLKILYAVKSSGDFLADLYDAFHQTDGSGLGIALSDQKSGALTLNLGKAETQNGKVILSLDIRYPVTFTEKDITERIAKAMPQATLTVVGRHLPLYVDPHSELVTSLMDAYNEVTGENAKPIAIGGATYARAFPNAVAFGPVFPGEDSKIHQKDESIALSAFLRAAEIYRRALEKLAF